MGRWLHMIDQGSCVELLSVLRIQRDSLTTEGPFMGPVGFAIGNGPKQ